MGHLRRLAWLDWVEIANLRVAAARVDLRFERIAHGEIAVKAWVRDGELTVERSD